MTICLFRALAVHLHGKTSLETSTCKIFNAFLEKSGRNPKQFCGVSMDNLPIVEDVVEKTSLPTISTLKTETS